MSFSGLALGNNGAPLSPRADFLKYLAREGANAFAAQDINPMVSRETMERYLASAPAPVTLEILAMKDHVRRYAFNGFFWPYLEGHFAEMFDAMYRGEDFSTTLEATRKKAQAAMDRFLKWEEAERP